MPCKYEGDLPPSPSNVHNCKEHEYKKALDTATKLLCAVMRAFEKTPEYEAWPKISDSDWKKLNVWWEQHKKMDAKRVAAKKKAASKIKAELNLKKKILPLVKTLKSLPANELKKILDDLK